MPMAKADGAPGLDGARTVSSWIAQLSLKMRKESRKSPIM